ncbi:MAG: hypothetical protein ABJF11_04390 [Reichenbachiella sp.]|uniref:TolB family protein n=1 Tax=Reichenbachiella sp. TaxID=2184521 RepID=UPI0032649EDB
MMKRWEGCIMILLWLASCQSGQGPLESHLAYQLPKETTGPQLFASGLIRTNNGICFTNDGYTIIVSLPTERKFSNGKAIMALLPYDYKDGNWQKGTLAGLDHGIDAYHPVLNTGNDTLFFNSRYDPEAPDTARPHDIWYSVKQENIWGYPKPLGEINSTAYDSYPSVARNGNLYFNSDREGGKGGMDIYVSEYKNGTYLLPKPLTSINSVEVENDLVVDPQERFIIFNRYITSSNSIDLYISHNLDGKWSNPEPLNTVNKSDQWELTPTLTPDGKYFFYELEGQIWQIRISELINI